MWPRWSIWSSVTELVWVVRRPVIDARYRSAPAPRQVEELSPPVRRSPRPGDDSSPSRSDTGGMTLAYDYPLLGVFWTMLEFFVLFAWIMALFYVIADLFRARDIGGFSKAVWAVFVIVAPFLGVFIYLLARGRKMAENQAIAVEEQ